MVLLPCEDEVCTDHWEYLQPRKKAHFDSSDRNDNDNDNNDDNDDADKGTIVLASYQDMNPLVISVLFFYIAM